MSPALGIIRGPGGNPVPSTTSTPGTGNRVSGGLEGREEGFLLAGLYLRYVVFREEHPRLFAWLRRYAIFLLCLAFTALYAAISLLKHRNFQSHGWDLGIFTQHFWQLSRFELGFNTVRMVPSLLGDHFHLIYFFIVPLYMLWRDPRMLLVIQAVVVALGCLPVYYVALRELESRICALCLAFVYLFFWGTMELIFFDFHEMAFAGPLVALAYFFIQRERWNGYLLTLPFLLMVKETMAPLVLFLGLYVLFFRRRPFEGLVTCLVSLGWFYAVTRVIMPALSGGQDYFYFKYYSHLGDNWVEVGKYLLTHPWVLVRETFLPYHKTKLLLFLLLPFAGLVFLGPFALVAIPELYQHLLSNFFPHWELLRHYHAVFAPILVFSVLEALPRLHRLLERKGKRVDFRRLALSVCFLLVFLQFPFTLSRSTKTLFDPNFYRLSPLERTGHRIVSLIPPDASVCAQDPVVPHLAQREQIYQYDGDTYGAEYVILNKFLDCFPFTERELVWEMAKLYKDPRYTAYRFGNGWVVFVIKPSFDPLGKARPLGDVDTLTPGE